MQKLKFNKIFYKKESLRKAIEAYAAFANCKLTNNANYFIVSLQTIDLRYKKIIADEFRNYALEAGNDIKF